MGAGEAGGHGSTSSLSLLLPGAAAPTLPAHPSTFTQVSRGPRAWSTVGAGSCSQGGTGREEWGCHGTEEGPPEHCPWESSEDGALLTP